MQKHWSQVGLIISIAVTFILVLGLIGETLVGGSDSASRNAAGDKGTLFLCTNPDCGESFEVRNDKLADMMQADGISPLLLIANPMFTCRLCGEKTAGLAEECDECGTIFLIDNAAEFPDTCTECGYSRSEAAMDNM